MSARWRFAMCPPLAASCARKVFSLGMGLAAVLGLGVHAPARPVERLCSVLRLLGSPGASCAPGGASLPDGGACSRKPAASRSSTGMSQPRAESCTELGRSPASRRRVSCTTLFRARRWKGTLAVWGDVLIRERWCGVRVASCSRS